MKLFRCLTFSLIALLTMSTAAFAQDGSDNAGNAAQAYDGGTFKLTPPKGWLLVSGNLSEKEIQKLPENIREHYNQRNTDIIFMDIDAQDSSAKGFKDSLNIVTINEAIPLTDELVKELSNVLKQQYESMFEKFDLESTEKGKIGENEALIVKGSYSVLNYSIRMEQMLIPAEKESLVMTCTYDTSKAEASEVIKSCRDAVASVVLSK